MRFALIAFCLVPLPGLADTIILDAPPTTVTAYASGALVTRTVRLDIPAGQHTLRIADMDPDLDPQAIDVLLEGATVTSSSWSRDPVGPWRAPRTPEWLAAKAAFDAATAELAELDDRIILALSRGQAAKDQIGFLTNLTLPEEAATDVETLRAIGQLIASDGTAARAAIQEAEAEARVLRNERPDLEFAVDQARAALDEVTPRNTSPATLDLTVTAAAAGPATLTLRYVSPKVNWSPTYRLYLEDDDTLRVERGALISQFSNEDWRDVSLTLSTLSPFRGSDPGTLWPLLRRIEDKPDEDERLTTMRAVGVFADAAAPAPVLEDSATATADFSGIGVSYALPGNVTVPARDEAVQIAFDSLSFAATLSARAVPRLNQTAFRQVSFDNTSPEILLPGQATLYVGGQLIGAGRLSALPPNADVDIFFGPIEGLRLTRTVLDRNEGDRGIITRSNEEREDIRLKVENLTDRDWQVDLRESVPFSEQEDLEISWQASPAPDDTAVDDRRGILEWRFDLTAGNTQEVEIQTTITWPEDKVLR